MDTKQAVQQFIIDRKDMRSFSKFVNKQLDEKLGKRIVTEVRSKLMNKFGLHEAVQVCADCGKPIEQCNCDFEKNAEKQDEDKSEQKLDEELPGSPADNTKDIDLKVNDFVVMDDNSRDEKPPKFGQVVSITDDKYKVHCVERDTDNVKEDNYYSPAKNKFITDEQPEICVVECDDDECYLVPETSKDHKWKKWDNEPIFFDKEE